MEMTSNEEVIKHMWYELKLQWILLKKNRFYVIHNKNGR